MEVDVLMKNVSHKDMPVIRIVGTAEAHYDITVTDGEGKPAVATRYERMLRGESPLTDHHSSMIDSLKPSQTMQEMFYVNQLYDLSKPGTYAIHVRMTVYARRPGKDAQEIPVSANVVTLTVTD